MKEDKEKCPCCGYYTFPKSNSQNYNNHGCICPICFWEIDRFATSEDEYSVSNRLSLKKARKNYKAFGACDKRMIPNVRKPQEDEL